MNAEQLISLAEALRSHALRSGRDLNASNLFVHRMLWRAMQVNSGNDNVEMETGASDRPRAADELTSQP